MPNGEPVGYVYSRADKDVRTVTPEQFDQLQSDLMTGAVPTEAPPSYGGTWYRRSDGTVFGVRTSRRNGATLDIIDGNDPRLGPNFKVHQR